MRRNALARIASSSASVPPTLLCQYSAGSLTDSPTSDFAAKWTTASTSRPAQHVADIGDRGLVEFGPGRHGVRVAGGQVVDDDDLVAVREQLRGHHAADVARSARHQYPHGVNPARGRSERDTKH